MNAIETDPKFVTDYSPAIPPHYAYFIFITDSRVWLFEHEIKAKHIHSQENKGFQQLWSPYLVYDREKDEDTRGTRT